jgi:hypothetical protein
LPSDGAVSKVTVNWVEDAEVTWPVPLLKVTVLLPAVVLKPVPTMVRVVAVEGRLVELEVKVGGEIAATVVATCTEVLVPPNEVTTAVRMPSDGAVSKVTVNWVEVAEVTWPLPLLKLTVFILAVGTKFVPVIVSVVALLARVLPLFNVTVGGEAATVVKPPKGLVQPVVPER